MTEAELWRAGVDDWQRLEARAAELGLGPRGYPRLASELRQSERALADGDVAWFGRRLPDREHWRLYPEFSRATAFLDIETTSLSPYEGFVTVVTVHAGGRSRTFVRGEDLEELPAYLGRFPVLVTFNGSRFDVPFLQVAFPDLAAPPVHIDLRFVLYRLGLAGGLKRIEAAVGLGDRRGVEGIGGLDAVRLWHDYSRGNPAALERLVRYNVADTRNLEPLLQLAVRELEGRVRTAAGPAAASAPALAAG